MAVGESVDGAGFRIAVVAVVVVTIAVAVASGPVGIYPPTLLALVFVECGVAEGMPSIKKVVRVRERLNRSGSLEGRVCHLSSRVEGIDIHSGSIPVDRVTQ